jgi:hypothetical protein
VKQTAHLPSEFSQFAVDSRHCKDVILPPIDAFGAILPPVRNIAIPFNFDAEFVDNLVRSGPLDADIIQNRQGVTVQIRGIAESTGHIFAHPDHADFAESTGRELRHPVMTSPCIVADWLQELGLDVEVFADPERYAATRKTCRLMMLAHFAIADVLYLAGTSEFMNMLVELYQRQKLAMGRRLIAKASGHKSARSGTVGLAPWVIRIGQYHYRLTLEIVDTAGLHGIASYAELASNVGIVLDAKETITRDGPDADIRRMDEIYFERPEDFDAYALGDLHVSDVIFANEKLWGHIWDALDIGHLYHGPKLTVGATVADMLQNRIAQAVGGCLDTREDRDAVVAATTGRHNAAYLSRLARDKDPASLLAKVDGGRCRNAKPTLLTLAGSLCDIDIGGAYASAMTATPLIFGRPRQVGFGNARDVNADLKACPTLAEWLRRHGHQLTDRAWFARISTREPFSFDSDLIPSWIGYRVTAARSDSELIGMDVLTDPASGDMRYFSREIYAGTLTSDLLDVARNTMSPAQFAEWSEKIVVRSALYVDQKDRIDVDDYRERFRAGTLPEFAWASMTLGELVSDVARANRMQYAKNSPLNILFKLVSNTTYGDSVSRHFQSSSAIAGSNVTATVRSFMYLAEKGLNLVGSVTDGQLFDLNRVLYPRTKPDQRRPHLSGNRRPSDLAIGSRAYRLSQRQLKDVAKGKHAPLLGRQMETRWTGEAVELAITHDDGRVEILIGKSALDRVDNAAFDHLVRLWPKCKLLADTFRVVQGLNPDNSVLYGEQRGIFRFETKRFVSKAALHGSANYWHVATDPTKPVGPKMRSFEGNREHWGYSVDASGNLIGLDTYQGQSPAQVMMSAILDDVRAVPILPPFVKTRILKPGVYQPKTLERWDAKGRLKRVEQTSRYAATLITPGDSIFVMGRPRLFSLSQFTFQTRAQYDGWRKATTRLVNRYGISFEPWFLNPDGSTVDFQAMVAVVDDAIVAGVSTPVTYLDALLPRRLSPLAKAFHDASAKMRDHLDGRLGADETAYETILSDSDGRDYL